MMDAKKTNYSLQLVGYTRVRVRQAGYSIREFDLQELDEALQEPLPPDERTMVLREARRFLLRQLKSLPARAGCSRKTYCENAENGNFRALKRKG